MNHVPPRFGPWSLRSTKLHRLAFLLRYHRFGQLWSRLRARARLAFPPRLPPPDPDLRLVDQQDVRAALAGIAQHRVLLLDGSSVDLATNRFSFLNQEASLPVPMDWEFAGAELDHLWRFHLHYQEYLLDPELNSGQVWDFIDRWIEGCHPASRQSRTNGWHPFCISKRIPVWLILLHTRPGGDTPKVLRSVEQQLAYLSSHLEHDVRGNHILENARALIFGSSLLCSRHARDWRKTAWDILDREVPHQILASGEHFERAASYHLDVFDTLLDILELSQLESSPHVPDWGPRLKSMREFTKFIRLPNGQLPRFGDSPNRSPAVVQSTMNRASRLLPGEDKIADDMRERGDYWISASERSMLIFDRGPAGADELPAHMHADLLQVEIWYDGCPVVVDSGVFDYGDTELRQYCRGTRAHNVLQIDGIDQFDFWGRFRVGYRGWTHGVGAERGASFPWAEACHNAYRRIGVAQVGRRIVGFGGANWACVDWAGPGSKGSRAPRKLASRLHLHPDCRVVQQSAGQVSVTTSEGGELRIAALGASQLTLEQGWFCPSLGQRRESQVVTVIQTAKLPTALGWVIGDNGWIPSLKMDEWAWELQHSEKSLHMRREL